MSEVSGNFCRKLYGEKESADVKIVCDDKQFDCHKVVLSSQREVSGARKYVAWAWGGCSHGDAGIVFSYEFWTNAEVASIAQLW